MREKGNGTYEDVLSSGLWLVLEVEADEMLGESSIAPLVNLVEHEVQQIESRDQSRRQVWGKEKMRKVSFRAVDDGFSTREGRRHRPMFFVMGHLGSARERRRQASVHTSGSNREKRRLLTVL